MALSNKQKIGAAALIAGTLVTAYGTFAENNQEPVHRKDNSCGDVNLVNISTYGEKSSATYHLVSCEKDQLGKLTMSEGTFNVDVSSIKEDYVIAALGQNETNRIGEVLEDLNKHLEQFPTSGTIYMHGMSCEPSVEFKGIENFGGTNLVVMEIRKEFSNAMPMTFGCAISQETILSSDDHLESRFGEKTAQDIRKIQELINKPLTYDPSM